MRKREWKGYARALRERVSDLENELAEERSIAQHEAIVDAVEAERAASEGPALWPDAEQGDISTYGAGSAGEARRDAAAEMTCSHHAPEQRRCHQQLPHAAHTWPEDDATWFYCPGWHPSKATSDQPRFQCSDREPHEPHEWEAEWIGDRSMRTVFYCEGLVGPRPFGEAQREVEEEATRELGLPSGYCARFDAQPVIAEPEARRVAPGDVVYVTDREGGELLGIRIESVTLYHQTDAIKVAALLRGCPP